MARDSQVLKRQREEVEEERETVTLNLEAEQQVQQQQTLLNIKRQKSSSSSSSSSSCNETLSPLDEGEEKLTQQDLSSLISTLQQALPLSDDSPIEPLTCSATSKFEWDDASAASEEEVEDRERVLRHLLEASDDELGLPSRDDGTSSSNIISESSLISVNAVDDVEGLTLTNLMTSFDGLWELEDEAANYYTLLQSELFMERDEHGVNY